MIRSGHYDSENQYLNLNLIGLRELRRDTATADGKPEALLTPRVTQGGYELSMIVFMLQLDDKQLARELINIGVAYLHPEIILPNASLSLTTKVAVAILKASA